MEVLKWFISFVWPPFHVDPHLNRWQRHMASSMIIVATSIVALSLAATGRLESVGIDGFASSKEVKEVQKSTKNIEEFIVSEGLRQAREQQCLAMKENQAAVKPSALRRVEEMRERYRVTTGRDPREIDCNEF